MRYKNIIRIIVKLRIVLSLVPFLLPLIYLYMELSDKYGLYFLPVDWPISDFELILYFFFGIARPLSIPFYSILMWLGLWEKSSFMFPTLPTLGGFFVVAIIYSAIIFWLVSCLKKRFQY